MGIAAGWGDYRLRTLSLSCSLGKPQIEKKGWRGRTAINKMPHMFIFFIGRAIEKGVGREVKGLAGPLPFK